MSESRTAMIMRATIVMLLCASVVATSAEASSISVKLEASAQGSPVQPIIIGRTNLPSGTKLLVILRREAIAYKAEDDATVAADGTFKGGPFSNNHAPLSPGIYQIQILMPVSAGQPQQVQAIIGSRGQNITGPTVQAGPHGLGKIVDYRTPLTVPGQTDTKKDTAERQATQQREQAYFEHNCYQIIDDANRMVDEGRLKGPKIEGAARQKKIDECLRQIRKP